MPHLQLTKERKITLHLFMKKRSHLSVPSVILIFHVNVTWMCIFKEFMGKRSHMVVKSVIRSSIQQVVYPTILPILMINNQKSSSVACVKGTLPRGKLWIHTSWWYMRKRSLMTAQFVIIPLRWKVTWIFTLEQFMRKENPIIAVFVIKALLQDGIWISIQMRFMKEENPINVMSAKRAFRKRHI